MHFLKVIGLILLSVLVVGCVQAIHSNSPAKASASTTSHENMAPTEMFPTSEFEARPYYLQVGDQFEVKFFYNRELDQQVIVRPDGRISLQLIDELQAAGLTPEALKAATVDRYKGILRNPEISIIVQKFSPQRIYIGGEVRNPGGQYLKGNLTALQAIINAGGFAPDAESSNVVLLRHNGTSTPTVQPLNLKSLLDSDGAPETIQVAYAQDLRLQPFDVIFVPRTTIGTVAEFFRRYVSEIVPLYRNIGLSFTYELHRAEDRVKVVP